MFTSVLYLVKHRREAIEIVTCLAGNIIILVSGRRTECLQFKESILQEFVKWGEKKRKFDFSYLLLLLHKPVTQNECNQCPKVFGGRLKKKKSY